MAQKRKSSLRRSLAGSTARRAAGSIPRAARILDCLNRNINTVTEISRHCHFAKSTVHRILKLLEQSFLVTEDPIDNRYYIGPLITNLATNPVTLHEYLICCSLEEMKHLSAVSEETVCLDILQGVQTIPLYEIISPHEIKVTDSNKRMGPLYTGASSKVLLSQLSDERLKIAMNYLGEIPKLTPTTVTDKTMLLSQIMEIRQQGYAVSFGERIPGALCISTPIHNYTCPVALSVIGPEYRLKTRLNEVIKEIKNSSYRISRNVLEIYEMPGFNSNNNG